MNWTVLLVLVRLIESIALYQNRLTTTGFTWHHPDTSTSPPDKIGDMTGKLIPWHKKVKVLQNFPEIGLWAVEKPIGVLSHPNHMKFNEPSVLHAPYNIKTESYGIAKAENGSPEAILHLLHRLDKATSGILLLADSAQTASAVKGLFKTRQVQKSYIAIVHSPGIFATNKFVWEDQYEFKKGMGKQLAKTEVTVMDHNPDYNLSQLFLEPKTGFMHQLRIQCALHGVPILGDDIHGNFSLNKLLFDRKNCKSASPPLKNRLYLHAQRIKFAHKIRGQQNQVDISSPIPDEFLRIIPSVQR